MPVDFIHLFYYQDDMFNQRTKKINNSLPKKDRRIPTEAWQVTRKHLKLTNKQISDMTDTPQGTVLRCSVIQPRSSRFSHTGPYALDREFLGYKT